MNIDIQIYYEQRATEYEEVYSKPERQDDLLSLEKMLQDIFKNRQIFEISCGTGYWTERLANTATSILASDYSPAVLDIARQKNIGSSNVEFREIDFYHYNEGIQYDSLFGGFIWSHIPLQDLEAFITKINSYVKPGGTVVFIDNNYVEGSSTPIAEMDEHSNTYQSRKLKDGSLHLVRKNFPTEAFIRSQIAPVSAEIEIIELNYYWLLRFTIPE